MISNIYQLSLTFKNILIELHEVSVFFAILIAYKQKCHSLNCGINEINIVTN
jgi:hypothetical protein